MEKAQIVRYALMQITALVYGILISGAVVKMNKPFAEMGLAMPSGYYHAMAYRDYGICLFLVVIAWTILVAYLASPLSRWQLENAEKTIASSGIALTVLFTILGTIIAFSAMAIFTSPLALPSSSP